MIAELEFLVKNAYDSIEINLLWFCLGLSSMLRASSHFLLPQRKIDVSPFHRWPSCSLENLKAAHRGCTVDRWQIQAGSPRAGGLKKRGSVAKVVGVRFEADALVLHPPG